MCRSLSPLEGKAAKTTVCGAYQGYFYQPIHSPYAGARASMARRPSIEESLYLKPVYPASHSAPESPTMLKNNHFGLKRPVFSAGS
jgi:hypothetical protein